MLSPDYPPGKITGFIQTYAFCQYIHCSATQKAEKKL